MCRCADCAKARLHQTLRGAGLVPDHGEEWVEIEMLNAEDAAILGCAHRHAVPAHVAG